jgi:aminoglycoside phosphotransferase (APT) family kinase protein
MPNEQELQGRIERFLAAQCGHAVQVQGLRRFPVGFSWLTYGLIAEGLDGPGSSRELILRLGSDAGLFAPYSALPQVLAMQSFQGTAVPVPRAYWFSDDPSALGAPFMFCEKVTGAAVVPWVAPTAPPLDEAYRRSLGAQFIDALAAIHRLRWQGTPIAALAASGSEVAGEAAGEVTGGHSVGRLGSVTGETRTPQITVHNAALQSVAHWEAQIARWAMRPYPLAEWGLRWLKAHAPVAPHVAVVHGDYRTGNFLEQGGRITAILDWELVHLGDPHEDLGWASLPMYMGGSPHLCRLAEPGWFYERYAQQAGCAVSMASVHYYQVFSFLKLAATHMAAARCFEQGRSGDLRMPAMGSQIATCLRQMDKAIERGNAAP